MLAMLPTSIGRFSFTGNNHRTLTKEINGKFYHPRISRNLN
jgi:hypothetical protein